MSKLHFYYGAMNAGKSTMLLQTNYNYQERGMKTLLFVSDIVAKETKKIASRIGLDATAMTFDKAFNLFDYVKRHPLTESGELACVLLDEAQFLTKTQVEQLTDIVDLLKIPVVTYGIRTDFKGELFEGSHYLLAWAEEQTEIKTICHCGRKATMNMRVDEHGRKLDVGPQVQVSGSAYIATCRPHYKKGEAIPFKRV